MFFLSLSFPKLDQIHPNLDNKVKVAQRFFEQFIAGKN